MAKKLKKYQSPTTNKGNEVKKSDTENNVKIKNLERLLKEGNESKYDSIGYYSKGLSQSAIESILKRINKLKN